jgi:hypothetical protein
MVVVARAPIAVAPNISMSQSGIMAGALAGGFVLWLAMNGKLAAYWQLLIGTAGGGASATTAPATTSSTSTSSGSTSTSSGAPAVPQGPHDNAQGGLPASIGDAYSLFGQQGPGSGTVGYNAFTAGAASGLTPGSAALFGGGG